MFAKGLLIITKSELKIEDRGDIGKDTSAMQSTKLIKGVI